MARTFFDEVDIVNAPQGATSVIFNGTVHSDVTVTEKTDKNNRTFKRAVTTLNFYGTPLDVVKNAGAFETNDRGFNVPIIASYSSALQLEGYEYGDQVTGAGYLFNQKGKLWIIAQKLARGKASSQNGFFKSSLTNIYLRDGEKPAFLIGTYRTKFRKDVGTDNKGCRSQVEINNGKEILKKLVGDDVTISTYHKKANLNVTGFGLSARRMRELEDGDTFIAGGSLSTSTSTETGKKYASFFASCVLNPMTNNTTSQSRSVRNVDDPFEDFTGDDAGQSNSSGNENEASPDTESGGDDFFGLY